MIEIHDSYIDLMWRMGHDWTSRAIAWWGQGYEGDGWSHVDAVTPKGLAGARADKIGGKPPGFYYRPIDYEPVLRSRILRIPCTLQQRALWLDAIDDLYGIPYDMQGIFSFILGRKPSNDGMYFCSAAQMHCQQAAGIAPASLNGLLPRQITPNALFLFDTALGARPLPGNRRLAGSG